MRQKSLKHYRASEKHNFAHKIQWTNTTANHTSDKSDLTNTSHLISI